MCILRHRQVPADAFSTNSTHLTNCAHPPLCCEKCPVVCIVGVELTLSPIGRPRTGSAFCTGFTSRSAGCRTGSTSTSPGDREDSSSTRRENVHIVPYHTAYIRRCKKRTQLGRDLLRSVCLHSDKKSVTAERCGVGNISSRDSRKRVVWYWHPLCCGVSGGWK